MKAVDPIGTSLGNPVIERVRHEVRSRLTEVEKVVRLTPNMVRVTLRGDDLSDFCSPGFDDHIKIIVPGSAGGQERRDYTPRCYDAQARYLVLDFAVHEAGPATRWALTALPGDTLQVAGPKGSTVVSDSVRRWLLIGDETALPAIGRQIEQASEGKQIVSIVAIESAADEQVFTTRADHTAFWVHRPAVQAADGTYLLNFARQLEIKASTFIWIAAEATIARAMRSHFVDERNVPKRWVKASGYWSKGRADGGKRID